MSKHETKSIDVHEDRMVQRIVCFVSLQDMPKFKEKVFALLLSTGRNEFTEQEVEEAVEKVAKEWTEPKLKP